MRPIVYHSYQIYLHCSQKYLHLIYKCATTPVLETHAILISFGMRLIGYHSYQIIHLIVIIHLHSCQKSLPSICKYSLFPNEEHQFIFIKRGPSLLVYHVNRVRNCSNIQMSTSPMTQFWGTDSAPTWMAFTLQQYANEVRSRLKLCCVFK